MQALINLGASTSEFVTFTETLRSLSRPLTKEPQFNDWLFQSMKTILQPVGYVVDVDEDSNSILQEPVNEYWTSHPDALIYKANGFSCEYLSSVTIAVDDNWSEEMNVEDLLPVEAVCGGALEVKHPQYTVAGINQCYSMSGAGAKLACMAMAKGKIVVNVVMVLDTTYTL